MGTFGKTFTREIGKNTGKWVSNKVFGDGHATPHKIIHAREREKARVERDSARNYREQQKELERDRRERDKRLAQREKEMAEREKQQMIESNITEVDEHNNYINVIQSVHKDYSKEMNWQEILKSEEPEYVKTSAELKDEITKYTNDYVDDQIATAKENSKLSLARLVIGKLYEKKYAWMFKIASNQTFFAIIGLVCLMGALYSMSFDGFLKYFILIFSAILFTGVYLIKKGAKDFNVGIALENTIEELENSRPIWIKENLAEQDETHKQYLSEKEDYKKVMEIAKGVESKNSQSYTYALNFFKPFEDLSEYGSDISFTVNSNSISVDYFVHSEEVIPNTIKKVLRKGAEVKEEQMPTSRFNEIYQDYVCSCVLRISKEVFQLLPVIDNVQVNAKGSVMNSATGNHEEKTIVSAKINRSKLAELNFELLDPSDSMSNFEHRMDFKKTEGFKPVEDLQVA
jgi:Skp family chaperone for outer membrane proteins